MESLESGFATNSHEIANCRTLGNVYGGRFHLNPEAARRTSIEIQRFCKLNYDVSFPMFEKLVTRRGPEQSPVYTYLGRSGNLPQWNFSKYVIDKQGKVTAFFPSDVEPDDPALRRAITTALAAKP